MRIPNEELIRSKFPNTKYIPTPGPNDTLLSIEKAKRVLGYAPKYNWIKEVELLKKTATE